MTGTASFFQERHRRRIAIWRTGHIGDLVCALPAITAVARAHPQAHISLITDAAGAGVEVARRCPSIHTIHGYGARRRGRLARAAELFLTLKAGRFDLLVYLAQDRTPGLRQARDFLLCRFAGIRRLRGFDWHATCWLRARRRSPTGAARASSTVWPNEVERLLAVVASTGLHDGRVDFDLHPTPADRQAADALWTQLGLEGHRPVVALAPGSRMPAKRWPISRYAHVAGELRRRAGATVLVIGSAEDHGLGEALVQRVDGAAASGAGRRGAVWNLCGRTDLGTCLEVLRRCDLYVGNDTGPMHLAAAVGVPCVAVFSARDLAGAWEPYGHHHAVLRAEVPCAGCLRTHCRYEPVRCLEAIAAPAVVRECLARLGRFRSTEPCAA